MGEVGIQNKLLERFCDFFLVEQRIRAKAYLMSVGIIVGVLASGCAPLAYK